MLIVASPIIPDICSANWFALSSKLRGSFSTSLIELTDSFNMPNNLSTWEISFAKKAESTYSFIKGIN